MNEETSMKDGPGTGEAAGLDAQGAAVIAQEARERARRELRVRRPVLFVTWGLVVLVSYGAMWLSVRGQHPYHGPAWETLLLAVLLFVAAAGAPPNVVDRRASGRSRPAARVRHSLEAVIRVRGRRRIMVALAALPEGDDLSFTRLQDLIELTPGNLITHLRKLQDAGYVTTERNGSGVTARTSVTVTHAGRAALEHYTTVLRELLDTASHR